MRCPPGAGVECKGLWGVAAWAREGHQATEPAARGAPLLSHARRVHAGGAAVEPPALCCCAVCARRLAAGCRSRGCRSAHAAGRLWRNWQSRARARARAQHDVCRPAAGAAPAWRAAQTQTASRQSRWTCRCRLGPPPRRSSGGRAQRGAGGAGSRRVARRATAARAQLSLRAAGRAGDAGAIARRTLWNGPTYCVPAYDLKFSSTICLIMSRGRPWPVPGSGCVAMAAFGAVSGRNALVCSAVVSRYAIIPY